MDLNSKTTKTVVYILLILGAVIMMFPFFWMIMTSFKTLREAQSIPPTWIPETFRISNYYEALQVAPFGRYFFNTAFVATVNTAITLVVTIGAAFAFSRVNFWGRDILFAVLLGTMMIPGEMLVITNFVTISNMGLIDTYTALMLPYLASVYYIFLLRQFFLGIPKQLYYSAKIDGVSDFAFIKDIMVPMAKPSLATIGLLNFIGSWNSFMWPLLVTNSKEMRVLSVGLIQFTTEAGSQPHLQLAATTMIIIPVVILFLFTRKYIVTGIANKGIKG